MHLQFLTDIINESAPVSKLSTEVISDTFVPTQKIGGERYGAKRAEASIGTIDYMSRDAMDRRRLC